MRQVKYVLIISLINFFLFVGIVFLGPSVFPRLLQTDSPLPTVTPTSIEIIVSLFPTELPVETPSPKPANCIVTINGQRYDVTSLKKTHSGGDIFKCGTDMTATFFNQHNQSLLDRQMAKYKI